MIKKPTEFIAEVKINYSDDIGSSMEKRFVWRPAMTYNDFMTECDKFYGFVRASYGAPEFDDLQKKNAEEEEVKDTTNVIKIEDVKKGE